MFLVTEDGSFDEMRGQPYESEELLQRLLADHPSVLAGVHSEEVAGREWLLVAREAGVPDEDGGSGRWSVDHLFLDREGIPTLVEVKRSSDSRIRREVIGQMLDYAANSVTYWPIESIQSFFEATVEASGAGTDPDTVLQEFVGDRDPEDYWRAVKTNLQAGRIRLVFVADEIPKELARVVEFLNEQMDPAEVLAIEVRQYVGSGVRSLVPTVVGRTAGAESRKSVGARLRRKWDEESFFAQLTGRHGTEIRDAAKRILTWCEEHDLRIAWGEGKLNGSFYAMLDLPEGGSQYVLAIRGLETSVWIEISFARLFGPFQDPERRHELRRRLNEVPGADLPEEAVHAYPSIPLQSAVSDEGARLLLATFDWFLDQHR